MAVSRYYSSSAVGTTLTAPISSSATTIAVASVTGFPIQYPYTLSIDADTASKELVEVSAAVGLSLTVTRGVDGTANVSHTLGAAVSHDHSARDFAESRTHENAIAAHGATGAVVGTTNTQTLTNKDLSAGSNIFPASLATDAEIAAATVAERTAATALTNKTLTSPVINTPATTGGTITDSIYVVEGLTAQVVPGAASVGALPAVGNSKLGTVNGTLYIGVGGSYREVATLDGSQTVTNKNLSSGNTFPTSLATLTASQALTNKDLTSGTNTFPSSLATDAEVAAAVAAVTPKMYARTQASVSSIATGTTHVTINNLATLGEDDGTFSYSAGVLTCVIAGLYSFNGNVGIAADPGGTLRGARILWHDDSAGTDNVLAVDWRGVGTNTTRISLAGQTRLAVGDTISLQAVQNSGGSLNTEAASTFLSTIRHGV